MVTHYRSLGPVSIIKALDFVLQQFTGQLARRGLLVVEVDREQSQTSWQRFSSEERLHNCDTASRASEY